MTRRAASLCGAIVWCAAAAGAYVPTSVAAADCALPAQHAGVTFSFQPLSDAWACRFQPIVTRYTTANKIGPTRTPLPLSAYEYLLDHPPAAATLVNRLDLGLYKAEPRGDHEFWATDGEGTEGVLQLVFRDAATRVYYIEGRHDGRFLPQVTGKAVVILRLQAVRDGYGREAVDSTMVAYLRLDNRFLSGLVSMLRPLIGHTVNRQLLKAFDAARLLAGAMRERPADVLFEATDPPALPDEDVAFVKQTVAALQLPPPRAVE